MKVIRIKKWLVLGQTSLTLAIDGSSTLIKHKDEISSSVRLKLAIKFALIKQPAKIAALA